MSSSSRSNSSTSTHSSATTFTPSAAPNFKPLNSHLTSLISLARQTLHPAYPTSTTAPHSSNFLAADRLLRIQDQLNVYFTKYPDYDWLASGYHKQVLEMQTLLRMVESALGLGHGNVGWPEVKVKGEKEKELRALQEGVYEEVEGLVFCKEDVEQEEDGRDSGAGKVESGSVVG